MRVWQRGSGSAVPCLLDSLGRNANRNAAPICRCPPGCNACLWRLLLQHCLNALQEMSSYQGWILGMLTNFEAGLALERIHNMLKMFQTSPPYDKTSAQLSQFLGRLVTEEKVTQEGELYKLRSA